MRERPFLCPAPRVPSHDAPRLTHLLHVERLFATRLCLQRRQPSAWPAVSRRKRVWAARPVTPTPASVTAAVSASHATMIKVADPPRCRLSHDHIHVRARLHRRRRLYARHDLQPHDRPLLRSERRRLSAAAGCERRFATPIRNASTRRKIFARRACAFPAAQILRPAPRRFSATRIPATAPRPTANATKIATLAPFCNSSGTCTVLAFGGAIGCQGGTTVSYKCAIEDSPSDFTMCTSEAGPTACPYCIDKILLPSRRVPGDN